MLPGHQVNLMQIQLADVGRLEDVDQLVSVDMRCSVAGQFDCPALVQFETPLEHRLLGLRQAVRARPRFRRGRLRKANQLLFE